MSEELVFGIHAVHNLFQRSPERVKELMVQKSREDNKVEQLIELANMYDVHVQTVNKKNLDDKVEGNHQGVIARVKPAQAKNENDLMALLDRLEEPALLLILDGVTDPHNLGACLRTADAAGVHGVIAPKDKAVGLTSVVSKVACGAAESVPFFQITNLARTLTDIQAKGVWIYGTAGEAEKDIYATDLRGPIAIVMGAEGDGMRRLTREHCDHLIKIPMAGDVSSLNVSVATGVTLFEAVRQRRR